MEGRNTVGSLTDKVAIITGGGTGIGQAIAAAFVEAGAKVALVGRRAEPLEGTAAGLASDQVWCCPCDVADRNAVNRMGQAVAERFGTVSILVNNAGTNTNPRSLSEVKPEDWDLTVAVNLTGVFNTTRAVLPGMRQQRAGLIINISSIAGLRAGALGGAAYSASKHGVVALNHVINEEEVSYNIRACVICPGEVETPLLARRPVMPGPEHRAQMLQPEDLAAAALFVANLPPRACVAELIIKPTVQLYQ
jgi:NADP-dependent 3-hydroxy acid dehydrogenase YdfG